MSAELLIASLVRIASEDLRGARTLADTDNRNAFYLCSQAAEKIVLAVLTSEGLHGGIKHQIVEMVDKVPDANPIKSMLRSIQSLEEFATTFRYPTSGGREKPCPDFSEFESYAANVEAALKRVINEFDVEIGKSRKPAGKAAPIRD